jgi:hypothetical protein
MLLEHVGRPLGGGSDVDRLRGFQRVGQALGQPAGAGDDDDAQARYVEVTVSLPSGSLRVASIYLPNGNPIGTAVISGKVTADGRPILWKNRDMSTAPHNEVTQLTGGRYKAIAVVNAGQRGSIWMGVNEAGFCIENSLSRDLAIKEKSQGPGNGGFMKKALETCATVDDFVKLLEETNESGRTTVAPPDFIGSETTFVSSTIIRSPPPRSGPDPWSYRGPVRRSVDRRRPAPNRS